MSSIILVEKQCSKCGEIGEHWEWETINFELSPELREDAASGKLFQWDCSKCGETHKF